MDETQARWEWLGQGKGCFRVAGETDRLVLRLARIETLLDAVYENANLNLQTVDGVFHLLFAHDEPIASGPG